MSKKHRDDTDINNIGRGVGTNRGTFIASIDPLLGITGSTGIINRLSNLETNLSNLTTSSGQNVINDINTEITNIKLSVLDIQNQGKYLGTVNEFSQLDGRVTIDSSGDFATFQRTAGDEVMITLNDFCTIANTYVNGGQIFTGPFRCVVNFVYNTPNVPSSGISAIEWSPGYSLNTDISGKADILHHHNGGSTESDGPRLMANSLNPNTVQGLMGSTNGTDMVMMPFNQVANTLAFKESIDIPLSGSLAADGIADYSYMFSSSPISTWNASTVTATWSIVLSGSTNPPSGGFILANQYVNPDNKLVTVRLRNMTNINHMFQAGSVLRITVHH